MPIISDAIDLLITKVGAFNTQFNFTGPTNVTFPTSGTLISTSSAFSGSSIYVSPTGNDVSGDGSILSPFATYAHAQSIAAPLATAANPYTIVIYGTINIAGSMTLSPFVNVCGINNSYSRLILTGSISFDPAINTTPNAVMQLKDLSINAATNVNLAITGYQSQVIRLDNIDFNGTPELNISGSGTQINTELFIITNCISSGSSPLYGLINISCYISNSTASAGINIGNTSTLSQNIVYVNSINEAVGDVVVLANNTGTQSVVFNSVIFYTNTLTIDGANNTVFFNSNSYNSTPLFSGGANITNTTLMALSDGILANTNFTPANYSPVGTVDFPATSVTGNLKGIDAALGVIFTGEALTRTNDTNVTITLGGTPSTALLEPVSLTMGWTGQLSLARGGSNANLTASNGGIIWSNATQMQVLAGTVTANQVLLSGSSATPAWSTATYPATTTINQILYSSAGNIITGLATAASSVLITSAGGVPSLSTSLPASLTITTPNIVGVTNASNASAGSVGEVMSSVIMTGFPVNIPNGMATDLTSIALTAGDWDIYGNITFIATVGATTLICWASTTSATLPDASVYNDYVGTAVTQLGLNAPFLRVNVNGGQNVYISGFVIFGAGTCNMRGGIYARRVR